MARMTRNEVGYAAATAVVCGTAATLANAGAVRLMGFSPGNTTMTLYDSAVATDAATDATVYVSVLATDGPQWFGPQGIRFSSGLVHIAGATDSATVFYIVDV